MRFLWAAFLPVFFGMMFFGEAAEAGVAFKVYGGGDKIVGEAWSGGEVLWRLGIFLADAWEAFGGGENFDVIFMPKIEAGFLLFNVQ